MSGFVFLYVYRCNNLASGCQRSIQKVEIEGVTLFPPFNIFIKLSQYKPQSSVSVPAAKEKNSRSLALR